MCMYVYIRVSVMCVFHMCIIFVVIIIYLVDCIVSL